MPLGGRYNEDEGPFSVLEDSSNPVVRREAAKMRAIREANRSRTHRAPRFGEATPERDAEELKSSLRRPVSQRYSRNFRGPLDDDYERMPLEPTFRTPYDHLEDYYDGPGFHLDDILIPIGNFVGGIAKRGLQTVGIVLAGYALIHTIAIGAVIYEAKGGEVSPHVSAVAHSMADPILKSLLELADKYGGEFKTTFETP